MDGEWVGFGELPGDFCMLWAWPKKKKKKRQLQKEAQVTGETSFSHPQYFQPLTGNASFTEEGQGQWLEYEGDI